MWWGCCWCSPPGRLYLLKRFQRLFIDTDGVGGVEVVGEGALIAGWFEMPRWAGLPGDRRLLGLFHEASQAHLCGA